MLLWVIAFSQQFTNINANLADLTFSAAAWGDYDNDNDLDLIILGMNAGSTYETKLYRNDGGDVFTEVADLAFPALAVGDVAFGDYDNDNDLDIVIMGASGSGSSFTRIYENKGLDEFSEAPVTLEQLYDGAVSWCDYNNDGFLDLMYSGFDDALGVYSTYTYKNNKDGTFTEEASIVLPGVIKGVIKWADYDKDGDYDFLFTGLDFNSSLISRIYKNNGNENFTQTEIQMIGVWLGDAAWGDFDMDGDLDLLLTGFNFNGRISKIYVNEGNDTFNELAGTPFPPLSHSSAEWGDYDNDGDLDILFCGVDEVGTWLYYTMIYINNGDNTFTESGISLPTVYWGESLWGDYDADGDLDIVFSGYEPNGQILSAIYRNDISTPNTLPDPPSDLVSVVNEEENEVILSWSPATDNETPSQSLSYNCYIYRYDGDTVWSPMSVLSSGKRLLTEMGNTNLNTCWTISGLEVGQYFWSVQSLDNSYDGSGFSPEESFIIGTVVVDLMEENLFDIYPNPTTDRILIKGSSGYDLILMNGSGQLIFNTSISKNEHTLDVSRFDPGIYYLQFTNGSEMCLEKIIIQTSP